jgi:hypothetical protein
MIVLPRNMQVGLVPAYNANKAVLAGYKHLEALALRPNHVHVRSSHGAELHIPQEHLEAALRIDPGLTILNRR